MTETLINDEELLGDYYNGIKKELINNEVNRKVKKYACQ